MITRVVARLLDSSNRLLAWADIQAYAKGDGKLWARREISAPVVLDGTPAYLSLHWADLNVESRRALSIGQVHVGQAVMLCEKGPIWTFGAPPAGLPAVTVGHQVIHVPVGQMGAASR
jgi:hypothetical protein